MLYLRPEVASSLGDDTFWTWMKREFPQASFDLPAELGPRDVVLQYSTLGACQVPGGKKVALLWELYPEMSLMGIRGDYSRQLAKIADCAAKSDFRVVASQIVAPFYIHHGKLHELPIGVDGDLFRPDVEARRRVRAELKIRDDATVGFWCGTNHEMKGFDRLVSYAKLHPAIRWIIVSKKQGQAVRLEGAANFTLVSQRRLADLMAACDFFLATGRLRPYFMVEWEAMAADLNIFNVSGLEKDFTPRASSREAVAARGWLRRDARATWQTFLTETVGAEL